MLSPEEQELAYNFARAIERDQNALVAELETEEDKCRVDDSKIKNAGKGVWTTKKIKRLEKLTSVYIVTLCVRKKNPDFEGKLVYEGRAIKPKNFYEVWPIDPISDDYETSSNHFFDANAIFESQRKQRHVHPIFAPLEAFLAEMEERGLQCMLEGIWKPGMSSKLAGNMVNSLIKKPNEDPKKFCRKIDLAYVFTENRCGIDMVALKELNAEIEAKTFYGDDWNYEDDGRSVSTTANKAFKKSVDAFIERGKKKKECEAQAKPDAPPKKTLPPLLQKGFLL